jgi:hypothetical protein
MRLHIRCIAAALVGFASVPLLGQSELVIVKEGTSQYHRPGCEVVSDGKGVLAMTRAQAEGRGLKAHAACDPSQTPAASPGAKTEPAAQGGTTPPVFVYVDGKAKQYHRETCAKLVKADRKKITLNEAGRSYWPCPVCKPPIRSRKPR